MFTNATLYRYTANVIDAQLLPLFEECSPSQEQSAGFVPPRNPEILTGAEPLLEHGSLMLFRIDTKKVPNKAVERAAKQRAELIEAHTGRKPGRKEMRDLKEEARQAMLPTQFPKSAHIRVWLWAARGLIVFDSTSQGSIDTIISSLVKVWDGFVVQEVHPVTSPTAAMSNWLTDEDTVPATLAVGRSCVLKASDVSKAAVRYDNHPLGVPEVRQYIAQGKLPVSLALEYEDRVEFTLDDRMRLRKIDYVGLETGEKHVDAFDADVVMVQAELGKTIDAVIAALGGEVRL